MTLVLQATSGHLKLHFWSARSISLCSASYLPHGRHLISTLSCLPHNCCQNNDIQNNFFDPQSSAATTRSMSFFDRLPPELRSQIWEYCLIHHEELIPFPTANELTRLRWKDTYLPNTETKLPHEWKLVRNRSTKYQTSLPCIALLAVSRSVRCEALPIFIGLNTWQISDTHDLLRDIQTQKLWTSHARLFRVVIVAFSYLNIEPTQRSAARCQYQGLEMPKDGEGHAQSIRDCIHNQLYQAQEERWSSRQDLMERMNLERLVLDLSHVYCPDGCCRWKPLSHALFIGAFSLFGESMFHTQLDVKIVPSKYKFGGPQIQVTATSGKVMMITGVVQEQQRVAIMKVLER